MRKSARGLLAVVVAFSLWGCASTMEVQRMEPIRLPHTYSVMLLTDSPPTDTQWKLLAKMEETLNFQQMLNVVYLPQVRYYDGSQKTLRLLANSGADTIILFHRLDLLKTQRGYRLVAKMSFLGVVENHPDTRQESGPGLARLTVFSKGDRWSSVELNQRVSLGEAINLVATRMALEMSDQIDPAQEARLVPYASPPGGLVDVGEEGGF